ncbi:MAG: glucose dehydrogenase [Planctomycetota bacterium]|nr:MAG: glucose dehydrogenase [Planctomycetota bacterium]
MTPRLFPYCTCLLAGLALAGASPAQRVAAELVTSGLNRPLFVTTPPGDTERLFILEQDTGLVRIVKDGVLLPAPFLDVGALASAGGERGLLGLAFHPQYAQNGHFYINFTANNGDTVVARYLVSATDPDQADAGSGRVLLTIAQPYANHNGGMLAFGPNDGYLYIGMGDGGGAGDPFNRAQNGDELLGKMLRIDVDAAVPYGIPSGNPFVGDPGFRDEIWAYGLRNPWRFSFDRQTGDLYIGDVGQYEWEEIDYQPGGSAGGENYGWRLTEGLHCFNPPTGCNPGGLTLPVHEYGHGVGQCVIGGHVYRGTAIPGMQGLYFFADYTRARVWSFRIKNGTASELRERTAELNPGAANLERISSFGEDASGEIYMTDLFGGKLYRIAPDLVALTLSPLIAGQSVTAGAARATPGASVLFFYSLTGTGLTRLLQQQVYLGLDRPVLAGSAVAGLDGRAALVATVPAQAAGLDVWVQAAELGNTSNVVAQTVQ